MTIEDDIRSTPDILRQTLQTVSPLSLQTLLAPTHLTPPSPALFLGSGSSHCVGLAAARLYEEHQDAPAQALLPSDYRPRPDWLHITISRTGRTTELIEAMRRARGAEAQVLLMVGELGSPAEEWADATIALPFASEPGVVQTRFITAALLALRRLLTDEELADLPEQVERGLDFDATALDQPHLVYLGRDWRYGLACSAALTLQETALMMPESHQTLDYRHGPIACADPDTLVWCFDPSDDTSAAGVLQDVIETGARVHQTRDDPLVSLVQAQLLAARRAAARGLDPEQPRHLTRAVVLPGIERRKS
jgi:glucosamine--fructose-6-phosphate aminotransferase (isomerizing)